MGRKAMQEDVQGNQRYDEIINAFIARACASKKSGKVREALIKELDEKEWRSCDAGHDSGSNGKKLELAFVGKGSRKTRVAWINERDSYIKVDGKAYAMEVKTNAGRIDTIMSKLENGRDELLCYSMDVCNSTTSNVRVTCVPRLMKSSTFIAVLEQTGAIKTINRTYTDENGERHSYIDGYGVDITKREFWKVIRETGVDLPLTKSLTMDEFDRL